MGAETVVNKILEKSASECNAIIEAAKEKASDVKSMIIADAESKAKDIIAQAQKKAELQVMQSTQFARLENRIAVLGCRHEIIKSVKEDAKKLLLALSDDTWIELYTRLISENPIGGDVKLSVPVSSIEKYKHSDILAKWAKILTEKTGVETTVTVNEKPVDTYGGLILCGEKYDIDLTFDSILDEIFEKNEKAIADKLFA